jgi:RimJ/RimL family protein N-acetyltransferase
MRAQACASTAMVAITSPDNVASSRLLEKLGFAYEAMLDFGRNAR